MHAVVARSTFPGPSQNVQSRTKYVSFGTLTEVELSEKCRLLLRQAKSKSKDTKHLSFGALFEVELSKKSARCCGAKHISKSKCAKHLGLGALLEVELSKNARR